MGWVWISLSTLLFCTAFVATAIAEIRLYSFVATFGESRSKGQQSCEFWKWMKHQVWSSCAACFVYFSLVLCLIRPSCTFCLQGFICKLVSPCHQELKTTAQCQCQSCSFSCSVKQAVKADAPSFGVNLWWNHKILLSTWNFKERLLNSDKACKAEDRNIIWSLNICCFPSSFLTWSNI